MPKEAIEPEVLETDETEVEQEAPESQEEPEEQSEESEVPEGDEETVIGFADEEDEEEGEAETPTIKRLRERNREQTRLLREREKRISELETSTQPAKIEVGPKPTLESCDWDETKFEADLDAWKERTAKADEQTEKASATIRKVQESFSRDLENYNSRKATLGIPLTEFEEAEATVIAALTVEQQSAALQAAKDPAAMIVALGRSPGKLAELAKIDNPWKLSAAVALLEGTVKVTKIKKSTPPDRAQRGSASMTPANHDKELERLEKEAERTGVRTAVIAYKKQMKAK